MSQITPNLSSRLQQVLLSPGFLIGLGVLLLNDFYLKQAFGSFLTGKLSDFAGLFILPLFLTAFLPNRRLPIFIGVAITFLVWKAPISDVVITSWNSFGILNIGRTIDYSDYLALAVVPVAYWYFGFVSASTMFETSWRQVGVGFSLILSVFAFTATTLTKDRTIILEDRYIIRERHADIQSKLRLNSRIGNVRVRRHDEVVANYPNVEVDRNIYFFDFGLNQPTCDSERTRMSFVVEENNSHTVLRGVDISFECRAYESAPNINGLDKSYVDHARLLFRQEILSQVTEVEEK